MAIKDFNKRNHSVRNQKKKGAGAGGKIGLTLFFLVFFLMGSLFEVMIARDFLARVKRRTWQRVPCTILQSRIEEKDDSDHPYVFQVQYQYQYQGRTYQTDQYAVDYNGSDSYDETAKLTYRYTPQSSQRCYVNPKKPEQAVLEPGGLWFGFFLLFPLIFVLIGLGGMIGIWIVAGKKSEVKRKRITIQGKKRPVIAAAFFGIFALAGIGFLIPFFLMPMIRIFDARDWQAVPCRILRSEVRSHDSDDGTTYSVHILYEYEFDGKTYRTDRYGFMGGSSSGYKGKRRIVELYAKGSTASCWIDPAQPTEAVLFRGFSPMMWFGLIPTVFLLVGVGGIVGVLSGKNRQRGHVDQPGWLRDTSSVQYASGNLYATNLNTGSESVELKPKHSRRGKFIGLLIFSVIWNAIVAFMVMTRIPNGPASPVPLIMVVIFGGIGLICIIGVIYQFLALFNPLARLRLSAAQVSLGDRLTVDWEISGHVKRLDRLTLTLTGKETAKYRKGTRTYTDHRNFYKKELVGVTDPLAMQKGRTELIVPNNSMHSFHGDNNHVVWSLTLHGDIPRWPDVKETFEITVTPMTPEKIAQQSPASDEEVAWAIPVDDDSESVQ